MLDEKQLRSVPTPDLVRHALEEARLLAKAEVLHAKAELKQELRAAKLGGALGGTALTLALCALSVFFVAIGLALPLGPEAGLWLTFAVLAVVAGGLGYLAYRRIPRKPLPQTVERLKRDVTLAREQLA
jgi:hypothetical protein